MLCLLAETELFHLQQDARRSLQSAFALGTFDNLSIQWVKFLTFCVYFQLVPFPATTLVLVWYTQFLSRKLKAHASIIQYLSGIKKLHMLLDYKVDGFHGILLKMTLTGLRCNNQHVVKKAKPMTPTLLKQIYSHLDMTNQLHVVFWGVCILSFLLLFRKSNMVPDLANDFNGKKQLRHADIFLDYQNHRVVVGIRWVKNHQFTKELLTFPLPKLPGSVLCPMRAVEHIKAARKWSNEQHLFQLQDGTSLTYRRFQDMLHSILDKIQDQDSSLFSSHSFRCGGITFAFLCGVPLPLLKILGNWKSDVYLTYIEFPLETRTVACELVKNCLLAQEKGNPQE